LIFADGKIIKEQPLPQNEASTLLRELASGKCVKISARAHDSYYATAQSDTEIFVQQTLITPIDECWIQMSFRTADEDFAFATLGKYRGLCHFQVSGENLLCS
jgi:hypothetical protein